jgi:hypothetical protein
MRIFLSADCADEHEFGCFYTKVAKSAKAEMFITDCTDKTRMDFAISDHPCLS